MKNKILIFIIGILIGAILATSGFFIYSKSINKNINSNARMQFENNRQMEPLNGDMVERPEKPQGDYRQTMQNSEEVM